MRTRFLAWLVGTATLLAAGPLAQGAAAQEGAAHLLVITGLSGEPRFAAQYREWGSTLVDVARTRYGMPAENVTWLAEREDVHGSVRGRSTRENVERALRELARRAGPEDRVLILLFGHGSFAGGETRVNLPGPDLTGAEVAALLEPIRARQVAVVNAASASGGYIQDLASPGRVVITATRTGFERNETVFGRHFVAALAGSEADADNDGRVSLLEAFEYARREVEREYQRENKLQTEHATLDGVGQGEGVATADPASPHARLAAAFHLASPALAGDGRTRPPELRRLYAEKERIEGALARLRAGREGMPETQYEAELEDLLVELALNARAIREMEEGS
jgi:hypothetical protein